MTKVAFSLSLRLILNPPTWLWRLFTWNSENTGSTAAFVVVTQQHQIKKRMATPSPAAAVASPAPTASTSASSGTPGSSTAAEHKDHKPLGKSHTLHTARAVHLSCSRFKSRAAMVATCTSIGSVAYFYYCGLIAIIAFGCDIVASRYAVAVWLWDAASRVCVSSISMIGLRWVVLCCVAFSRESVGGCAACSVGVLFQSPEFGGRSSSSVANGRQQIRER